MPTISRIGVFCGSNTGRSESYQRAAADLGAALARSGIGLVYGGTNRGLMGSVADACLAQGGRAHGVITEALHERGHSHSALTELEIVPDLRSRKRRMIGCADAFVALPGGIGTFEEFMEIWSLNQLGELNHPLSLYDVNGFFQPLMGFVDRMIEEAFLPPEHREAIVVSADPDELIQGLGRHQPVAASKWIGGG